LLGIRPRFLDRIQCDPPDAGGQRPRPIPWSGAGDPRDQLEQIAGQRLRAFIVGVGTEQREPIALLARDEVEQPVVRPPGQGLAQAAQQTVGR